MTNKKSQSEISSWVFRILYVIAIGMSIVILVKLTGTSGSRAASLPDHLEDELIIMPRFYTSEKCFAYQDEIGWVHSKVIDLNKFNQDTLDLCFPATDVQFAYALYLDSSQLSGLSKEAIFTKNWRDGTFLKRKSEEVLIYHNGDYYDGILIIDVKNVK